ncbi:44858_t:CDS:1, partial [Gigaspora margarita]
HQRVHNKQGFQQDILSELWPKKYLKLIEVPGEKVQEAMRNNKKKQSKKAKMSYINNKENVS